MNLANLLSLFRLALVPIFVAVFSSPWPNARYLAVGIYALAALTDVLDGFIARRYGMVTRLGRVLDPLADKLMTFAVIICITMAGIVPIWVVVIFVIKEVLMGIGALSMYNHLDDVPAANLLGKSATTAFFVACVVLILLPHPTKLVATLIILPAIILMLAAFFCYLGRYLKLRKEKNS